MKKEVLVVVIVSVVLVSIGGFFIFKNLSRENVTTENQTLSPSVTEPVLYKPKYSFYNFTDPRENAFSIEIPEGWQVSSDSGLIRPYIDAGVKLQATSSKNQGFFYISPYGVYTVPNDLLTFAGFPEGSYYDPSGGLAQPMLVKSYTEAKDFLEEYVSQLNVETNVLEVIDRPDLINEDYKKNNPLITKQSAAEITYISNPGTNEVMNKVIAYIYLVEYSGVGIWASSLFGYSSPESLFNETEYLVLKSSESFKINPSWAAKEADEVNKRTGMISSTQDSISDTISSTFEYRSDSQDRINHEWSKTILGVEEVYNPETGDTKFVDSGSKYYWMDNKNNIYGTETDKSPFPLEDMTKLEIKKEV
jgi:hypothetical protein